jgi:alpha-N-acetylglucosamine transferase
MPDYLVYLTVGYNPEFSKLVDLCVKSILATNDTSKIDICIMCDEHYAQYINHLPVKIHTTGSNTTPVVASMRKLEVFNIPDIYKYKRVLFLDGDILVTKSLLPILESATDIDKLYVFEETQYENPHTSIYFSHITYTPDQIRILDSNNVKGFNCGQFVFTPTPKMKQHFSNIIQKMNNYKGQFHYEQSFMNVYFNLNHKTITERTMLQEYVQIYPEYKTEYPSKTIIHFTGTTEYTKLERMVSLLQISATLELKNMFV